MKRSRSWSSMARKRTHSLELSSWGSMSRMRSWDAARWRRAMERGRLVTASSWRAPKPPLRMAGVLYMATRGLVREGIVIVVVVAVFLAEVLLAVEVRDM